jgi:SAM-dependent methyltransferase
VNAEAIDALYRAALRRPADSHSRSEAERRLAAGELTLSDLLVQLVASEEFARLQALDSAIAFARKARANGERPHELTAPVATDERLIEIPWVLARYRGEPRVLDLGSAHAEQTYLDALLEAAPGAIGVDIAPADIRGLELRAGDLRRLPFVNRSFDVVFCISTLEHVGSSQEPYGVVADSETGGIPEALDEIRRVLAPRGYALVTVPCGRTEDHGWFVQRDRAGWNDLYAAADLYVSDQELYVLGSDGWRAGEDDRLAYGERGPGASAVLCSELHPGRLRHEAARSAHRLRGGRK